MFRLWRISLTTLLGTSLLLVSATAFASEKPPKLPPEAGVTVVSSNPISDRIRKHLIDKAYPNWAPDLDWKRLEEFYHARGYQPAWRDTDDQPYPYAEQFRSALENAAVDGLDPKEYHIEAIVKLWSAHYPRSLARLDFLLTDAFFRYSVEVRAGYLFPRAVDPRWYMRPPKVDPLALLEEALAGNNMADMLATLPPQHPEYQRLRNALHDYVSMHEQWGEWPKIPPTATLRLGSWDYAVAPLRERLIIEGYLTDTLPVDKYLFDRHVEQAVRGFQRRYGHKEDGIVGPRTRSSLNVTLEERIAQIQRNMERWRWMPRSLGSRYVMVNMAGYKLFLVENGVTTLDMRVIIGKPYKGTPAFKQQIEYMEINPVWNVPPRIAKYDLLPKIQKNEGFIKANHMRVYENWKKDAAELDPSDIDWQALDSKHFPYKLAQDPGPYNSLGRIKFMFPNSWRIYLHDTPARNLFNREVRTFSSGCIRVERPVSLAERLLGEDNWNKRAIRDKIRAQQNLRVDLPEPVPIYLMYWTAWVEEDGSVHFRDDVYNRNENIAIADDLEMPSS